MRKIISKLLSRFSTLGRGETSNSEHEMDESSVAEQLAVARTAEILRCEDQVVESFYENESNDHKYLRQHIEATFSQIELAFNQLNISVATQKSSYQLGLSASFLRTDHILRRQLERGHLIEAMVLMRKQIELLARFKELDDKSPEELKKRTPNVSAIKNIGGIGRMYGELSGIAHFSDVYVTELLGTSDSSRSTGRSIHVFPKYQSTAHDLFQNYCILCIYFTSAIVSTVPKWDSSADLNLVVALGECMAQKAGSMGFFGADLT